MTNGITHICQKEANIATIDTNLENMKKSIDRIEKKIDTFIEKSDNKYATKEELNDVEIRVNKLDKILFGIGTWAILGLFGVTISLIVYIYITNLGK